jgi:aspartate/methionine/tyrosine aminotransferase
MTVAHRLEGIGEYYFSAKLREIEQMNRHGNNVINLGIGSPDLPPHPDVIRILQDESAKPNVHAYQSYKGTPVLRKAIAGWYQRWYGVDLDPETQILPLIGSKEGIMHICMTYLNPGDVALVPNPGYPTYRSAVKLAGGSVLEFHLREKDNWFPDFDEMENRIHSLSLPGECRVKLLFVNYPHMPTGQLPEMEMMQQLIAFAQKHDLLIIHDNPYSFILNDHPLSLLSLPGAMDRVLELNSLSKSQNMAGWRIGMLCAAKERIDEVLRFKSNMDSGMFLPVQLAAARALELGPEWYESLNKVYRERREKAFEILDTLGCNYDRNQAGMFVWAAIPGRYKDGYALSDEILHQANVFITPGGIFGDAGDRFVRISLCSPSEKMQEALERIGSGMSDFGGRK